MCVVTSITSAPKYSPSYRIQDLCTVVAQPPTPQLFQGHIKNGNVKSRRHCTRFRRLGCH